MDIQVQIVKTLTELHEVQSFTHDRYVEMGYCEPQPDKRLIHHEILDLTPDGRLNPNTEVVFIRDRLGTLIGTCSITLDSEDGLHTDLTFSRETDIVRDECRVNFWRLAACWRDSYRSFSGQSCSDPLARR